MANVYPIDANGNYRDPAPQPYRGETVTVTAEGVLPSGEQPDFDPATGTTQIPTDDGGVVITFGSVPKKREKTGFHDNLAEDLMEDQLSVIAERLLRGIEQDEQSRAEWLENVSNGIKLLGLEIKTPRGAAATGATPAEGVSTVDHPLLLEAVLRFQANARGELLPADGPVKVRNDGEGNTLSERLAQALEKDLNHYLTKTAKEYVPDTDKMLLLLGFGGISFKKGYHDPIKRRPVIASIHAKDLIVSNATTDLDSAGRVTHRIMMRPSLLKRMQLVGAYRDIDLPDPGYPASKNPVDTTINQIQGIAPPNYVEPDDQERELLECYCEIEIPGFEHKDDDGHETGLPIPYKVVIDRDARRILEIRRNYEEDDPLCLPRNRIIAYVFIPGLGFYGIGLLNVLGNATKAVTAAWRLMLDAGMFSNFPGFLYVKSLAKQLTNQFRIPPGGGQPIDTVGNDIRASVMPLPYKDPSAVFIQLIDNIATTAQRVGGTTEMQVGEGKQDAPVGTTLAMIEQATKLMSAVHKRLHQAQSEEFAMLKSLLSEDPEALWRHNKKKSAVLKALLTISGQDPVMQAEAEAEERHRELFLAALADCELVPRADPNTASQTERYLKVVAMRQMALTNPNLDINHIDEYALHTMGVDDARTFFKPPTPPNPTPPPEAIAAQAAQTGAQAKMIDSNAKMLDSQTKAKEAGVKAQGVVADATIKAHAEQSKEKIARLGVAKEMVIHAADGAQQAAQELHTSHDKASERLHKLALQQLQQQHDHQMKADEQQHSMVQQQLEQQADQENQPLSQPLNGQVSEPSGGQ